MIAGIGVRRESGGVRKRSRASSPRPSRRRTPRPSSSVAAAERRAARLALPRCRPSAAPRSPARPARRGGRSGRPDARQRRDRISRRAPRWTSGEPSAPVQSRRAVSISSFEAVSAWSAASTSGHPRVDLRPDLAADLVANLGGQGHHVHLLASSRSRAMSARCGHRPAIVTRFRTFCVFAGGEPREPVHRGPGEITRRRGRRRRGRCAC